MDIRQIAPMLAQKKDLEKFEVWDNRLYFAQEKFDGERVVLQITQEAFAYTGRRISTKTGYLADKTGHVPHLAPDSDFMQQMTGTVLDGELIHPHYFEDIKKGFRSLSAVMRSLPERAIRLQEETGFLEYHVYDILEYRGKDLRDTRFIDRLRYIEAFFDDLQKFYGESAPPIHEAYTARTTEDKRNLFDLMVREAREGLIFRHAHGVYQEGKKSADLLKLKAEFEIDAVVMGFEQAKPAYTGKEPEKWHLWAKELEPGLWTKEDTTVSPVSAEGLREMGYTPVSHTWFYNLPATVIFGCYKDGVLTERGRCSGFDYETSFDMRDNMSAWLGQAIEVTCNGFYPSGKLRHPDFSRLRYDKSPEECVWTDV